MTKQAAADLYRSFSLAFFNALAGAMSEASGSPWLVAAVPDSASGLEDALPVWVKLDITGSVEGEVLLEFRRTEATLLLSRCSRKPIGEFGKEQADDLLQLIDVAIREFLPAVRQLHGTFAIEASSVSEPPAESGEVVQFTATDGDSDRLTVTLHPSPELVESLSLSARKESPLAGNATSPPFGPDAFPPDPVNLKLVLDVELSVTLRFGQRQLTLREVLELTTGSVVELDRHVEEPVELLLEGRVIARGEAVVIDGNYGIRVSEVVERMASPLSY